MQIVIASYLAEMLKSQFWQSEDSMGAQFLWQPDANVLVQSWYDDDVTKGSVPNIYPDVGVNVIAFSSKSWQCVDLD
jgi:hypothetical protein